MSIFEFYTALMEIPGVFAAFLGFLMLWFALGIDRKKYLGLMGCVLLMIIGSIVGVV